ncbi:MAG: biotin transporter BioY [Clostridiales bacterium]|nr:biotin transporter BioY [Clostridiales bacterium]
MKTKDLVFTALFAAITAICSQISIPLPFSPVPITLSLVAVFLTGGILNKRQALFAQLTYILLGSFGVPVFSGFRGGMGVLVGPTGGYLAAYPLMAFLIAYIIEKYQRNSLFGSALGMSSALMVCYLFGSAWLAYSTKMGWYKAFLAGVAPFVLLDLIKISIVSSVSVPLRKAMNKIQFGRLKNE